MGFFERLKAGLTKTKNAVFGQIHNLLKHFVRIDEEMLEELEELLISADVGVNVAMEVVEELREAIKEEGLKTPEAVEEKFRAILLGKIGDGEPLNLSTTPSVILVIGVNGVGKTTSIAKIANLLKHEKKKVLLAAGDTFRAAAADQLEVWANRVGVDLVRQAEGADPASVVFDAIQASKKRGSDVLIIDTAGRLHNKKNLMDELAKINRVIARELPEAARETLLVLDATTGQNAVSQAKAFKDAANITGLVLTKLDGTAKGGIVFSIKEELNIPVKFICVGEQADDLQRFDAKEFVAALFD